MLAEEAEHDDVGGYGLTVREGPFAAAVRAVLADVVEGLDLLVHPRAVEELVGGLDEAAEGGLGVACHSSRYIP